MAYYRSGPHVQPEQYDSVRIQSRLSAGTGGEEDCLFNRWRFQSTQVLRLAAGNHDQAIA
jgi:hypothetical protein